MRIYITGITGFIGRHLAGHLRRAGHEVTGCARHAETHCDFSCDDHVDHWLPRLQGIDVVINTVGILSERGKQTFDAVHGRSAIALFGASEQLNVKLVIQFSALGADEGAVSAYHQSKYAADQELARMDVNSIVLQPSLVYGAGGASARLFQAWSALPIIPVPGAGTQRVQPIHIDDVCCVVAALIDRQPSGHMTIPLVGPASMTIVDWMAAWRAWLELPPAPVWCIPAAWVKFGAALGDHLRLRFLRTDNIMMLSSGSARHLNSRISSSRLAADGSR